MKKTTYWKDVWRTFVASKGRMLSIALLMALGSFALIGLTKPIRTFSIRLRKRM